MNQRWSFGKVNRTDQALARLTNGRRTATVPANAADTERPKGRGRAAEGNLREESHRGRESPSGATGTSEAEGAPETCGSSPGETAAAPSGQRAPAGRTGARRRAARRRVGPSPPGPRLAPCREGHTHPRPREAVGDTPRANGQDAAPRAPSRGEAPGVDPVRSRREQGAGTEPGGTSAGRSGAFQQGCRDGPGAEKSFRQTMPGQVSVHRPGSREHRERTAHVPVSRSGRRPRREGLGAETARVRDPLGPRSPGHSTRSTRGRTDTRTPSTLETSVPQRARQERGDATRGRRRRLPTAHLEGAWDPDKQLNDSERIFLVGEGCE